MSDNLERTNDLTKSAWRCFKIAASSTWKKGKAMDGKFPQSCR